MSKDKQPTQPTPIPAKAPEPAQPAKAARFKVWPHGSLARDGVVFAPGEELPLSEKELVAAGLIANGVAVRIED